MEHSQQQEAGATIEAPSLVNNGDVTAVADAVAEQMKSVDHMDIDGGGENDDQWITKKLQQHPPPDAFPTGWILKQSRSQPSCYYYYNQETGVSRWDLSSLLQQQQQQGGMMNIDITASKNLIDAASDAIATVVTNAVTENAAKEKLMQRRRQREQAQQAQQQDNKRSNESDNKEENEESKRAKVSSESTKEYPKEVRVLHLLKKHKGSRRPASWRNPKITCTIDEAKEELDEFLSILQESSNDYDEMKATFEELARTESDCSSAKRGGDLGFFGPRKMQPAFEKAAFNLKIGELSGIVDTSSGVHILLRIG